MAHPSSNSSGTNPSVSKSLTEAPDFSSGHILTKVTINGKEFHAWDMPDKGWHIYPWQKYKIVVDDIERGHTFRVEYAYKATLSNLEGDLGSSHMQGTPKAQGHEADNLSAESAGETQ